MASVHIGIVGAGIMGGGIAQVAAVHGCTVALMDASPDIVHKAIDALGKRLSRLVEKGQMPPADHDQALRRLRSAADPAALAACDLVLEAVTEDIEVKTRVLRPIVAQARADTIFASNTSSLSITRIGQALGVGRRMVGMHFFNPPALMPLVEVVAGAESDPDVVEQVAALARSWGKTVVHARDTPGFIVNRVARGYYLEALRMLDEGVAGIDEIDRTMRQLGGFKLGPFELMDLVGIDVNYSVSTSVWEQLGKPARLRPHPIQADLRRRGQLGRKTKRGFYDYAADPPMPALSVERRPLRLGQSLRESLGAFVRRASDSPGSEIENYIFARILATLINEAAMLHDEGVASAEDIDAAMRLGTNYPRGPLEWAEKVGFDLCRTLLLALNATVGDDRFQPATLLRGRDPSLHVSSSDEPGNAPI